MTQKQTIFISIAVLLLVGLALFWKDIIYLFTQPETFTHEASYNRRYSIRLPKHISEENSYPLIIMLHGYKGHAKLMELYSGMTHLAKQEDFIIAYPYGTERSWNGGFCCGTAFDEDIDDEFFIEQLIEDLKNQHPVNPEKIYLVGFSNGGVLAQQLIARDPNAYAGAAIVMSGAGDDSERMIHVPDNPPPMLFYFGDEDKYIGQEDAHQDTDVYQFFPAEKTKELWLSALTSPSQTTDGHDDTYTQETYTSSSTTMTFRTYFNQEHQFPQWRTTRPFTKTPQSVKDIWEFFKKH